MIHIHKLLILFFIIHSSIFAQNWNEAVNAVSKRLVLIEYYEQLNSMESMEDKEKIKKHLTGILVSADGLILTSSSIFKASLEFNTFSYLYNPFQKPVQIRVKINGSGYLPAEFIGKDDDVHLAFIKLKTQPDISPVLFKHRDPLQLGERVLILQHLTKAYDYNLLVNERLINAIVDKPQTKYLCEPTLNSLSDFGLTLNGQGQPVGLYISPLNEGRSMLDFHDMSENEPKEILPAESFRKLIENPPVFREKNPSRKKWLGIYMQPYPEKMAAYFGNGNIKGILVNTVIEDSPADRAGIKVGDVITDIDGKSLRAETEMI